MSRDFSFKYGAVHELHQLARMGGKREKGKERKGEKGKELTGWRGGVLSGWLFPRGLDPGAPRAGARSPGMTHRAGFESPQSGLVFFVVDSGIGPARGEGNRIVSFATWCPSLNQHQQKDTAPMARDKIPSL